MRSVPRTIASGDPVLQTLLNDILATLRRQRVRGSSTIRVSETAMGSLVESLAMASGSGTPKSSTVNVQLFQVLADVGAPHAILGDVPYNDASLGYISAQAGAMASGVFVAEAVDPILSSPIKVAKPAALRQLVFVPAFIHPAYVQTRVPYLQAPLGSAPNTQPVAQPQYIYAINNPQGGTGVQDPDNPAKQLTWLDLNVDARTWGYPKAVCINGNNSMLQVFAASVPYIPPSPPA